MEKKKKRFEGGEEVEEEEEEEENKKLNSRNKTLSLRYLANQGPQDQDHDCQAERRSLLELSAKVHQKELCPRPKSAEKTLLNRGDLLNVLQGLSHYRCTT